MPSDIGSADVLATRSLNALPDLSRRSHLSELMDEPCSYEGIRECLHDLARLNRITLAYRPTLQWLEQFAGLPFENRPLHVVDVGCGGGDMLRRIERWAARKRVVIRLTGIDLNPYAIRAARETTSASSRIQWIVGEAYLFDAVAQPVDLVISSLFAHHLPDDEIPRFIEWMERVTHRGWFINDLYRSRISYVGFKALAITARWHRFIRHDGPVSIRCGFLPNEWRQYAEDSGLSPHSVCIDIRWPACICVARIKQP